MDLSLLVPIFTGVSVFVLGQFLLKLVLEPAVELKKTIGTISALFLREQPSIISANATEEVAQEMQRLASELIACRQAIPGYRFWSVVLGLPKYNNILKASGSLNLLSALAYQPGESKIRNSHLEVSKSMKSLESNLNAIVSYQRA